MRRPAWSARRLGDFGRGLLLVLLIELWLLNLADLLLTRHVLWRGLAQESNFVMDYFFRQGTLQAAAFKVGIVTIGVLLLWRLRHYPAALAAAVLLTLSFAAVVAYQLVWVVNL